MTDYKVKRKLKLTFIYAFLIFVTLFTLFPFFWTLRSSLLSNHFIQMPNQVIFPPLKEVSLNNYIEAFKGIKIFMYLKNSLIVAACNIIGTLLTSSMAAYSICKLKFRGSKILYKVFLSSMMLPGMVMLVPTYMLMVKLGFINSLLSLIVPGILSVYGIFFMRAFFLGTPNEIAESARIDGAGEYRIFFTMYIPQVRVGLIILGINTFNGSWNAYLSPSLYLKNDSVKTLVVALRDAMTLKGDLGVNMAFSLIFSVPVVLIFIFAQKYFMTGFSLAGIKE